MKRSIIVTLITLFYGSLAIANIMPKTKQEIAHLLNYVKKTSCKYERNGKIFTGTQAAEHIQNKYNHFKSKIRITEDFIRYSATKSTLSGKFYHVHCQGEIVKNSAFWLQQELNNYRHNTH
ncbi:DUF5329 family protein [Zooshikella harenae]|uniref:DUF5329 family protein n=1 Tax=Zooshikella harenae TaxID=2827238 RepID=A0ABS5ZEK9_9GAMM|nr:DUF5329 family protein [Zooshikella harenae]MBU2712506.1 DUF5329 family protein [Zooshikella harenae]